MFASAPPGPPQADIAAKRKKPQAKVACTNCRRQHAGCTDTRPCDRCVRMGLAATCEDTPKKKRAKKKAIDDYDEDDHYESVSDINGGKSKGSSANLLAPPPPKRPKRASTANTKKKSGQLMLSDVDSVQSALLPPGTLPTLSTTTGLAHGMNPGAHSYSLPTFDTSSYLDSLALSRQFPYATPPGYGAHAGYATGHENAGMSAFPGLSQPYSFYQPQYGGTPYGAPPHPPPHVGPHHGHHHHPQAHNLSPATVTATSHANLASSGQHGSSNNNNNNNNSNGSAIPANQQSTVPSTAPSGPPALHGLPPAGISATTTASSSSSAQQQSSSSYSTNIRGPMLPSHPRYMPNPMASLPSFPYNHMYNPAPSWMGYPGAPSGPPLHSPLPLSLSNMSQPLPSHAPLGSQAPSGPSSASSNPLNGHKNED